MGKAMATAPPDLKHLNVEVQFFLGGGAEAQLSGCILNSPAGLSFHPFVDLFVFILCHFPPSLKFWALHKKLPDNPSLTLIVLHVFVQVNTNTPESVFQALAYLKELLIFLHQNYILPALAYTSNLLQRAWANLEDSCKSVLTAAL